MCKQDDIVAADNNRFKLRIPFLSTYNNSKQRSKANNKKKQNRNSRKGRNKRLLNSSRHAERDSSPSNGSTGKAYSTTSCLDFSCVSTDGDTLTSTELGIGPDDILMLGYSHWPARVLLAACEFRLFCKLAAAPGRCMTHGQIVDALQLHPTARQTRDFLDALVALQVLVRIGNNPATAVYTNATEADIFLVEGKATYIGDVLEICSKELYLELDKLGQMLKDRSVPYLDVGSHLNQALRTAKTRLVQAKMHGQLPPAALKVDISHERVIRLGFAFWESRVLLTAVDCGLFTTLNQIHNGAGMTQSEIMEKHGFCSKNRTNEFLRLLVKNGILEQVPAADGAVVYRNSPEAANFLDARQQEDCVGDSLAFFSNVLYGHLATLPESLQTGVGKSGLEFYLALYENPAMLTLVMESSIGWSSRAFREFVKQFDFSRYHTLCDIGGATGQLAAYIAKKNWHLQCTTTDLPQVLPIAESWIKRWGTEWNMKDLKQRVVPVVNNFFEEEFPKAEVITMSGILNEWCLETKKELIKKAYDALPDPATNNGVGGALVSIEQILDDERKTNVEGFCMSMLYLVEGGSTAGYGFTQKEFNEWCTEVGFKRFEKIHLYGPTSAVIAYKE